MVSWMFHLIVKPFSSIRKSRSIDLQSVWG